MDSDNEILSDAEVVDDEVDDPTYSYEPRERRPTGASIKTTPSERIKQERTPYAQKRKVVRTAGAVCLIERVSRSSVIEYCHVIGKKEPDAALDYLVYYWGMPRYTLNLHTRYNICILGPRLHYLFDNKGLLFLPTQEIIEQYMRHNMNAPLPYKPDDPDAQTRTFEYHMLVPPYMEGVGIFRRKVEDSTGTNAEDFEVHPFPYNTLPVITSHLLPHYVIYNAGKKLSAMQRDFEVYNKFLETNAHIEELSDMALKAAILFLRWTQVLELPSDWLANAPPSTRSLLSHSSRAPTEARRRSKRTAGAQGPPTTSKRAKQYSGQGEQDQQAQGQQDDLDGLTLLGTHLVDKRSDRQIHNDKRCPSTSGG
ncbi:hypothetical protein HYPSUDRAFT_214559 [Hypholoma sublateritium FD-334 SS-4]|uniref:HNH nuclease domain-containing protein n=1 Tax=Hypholoma sublateritium (strain FD-334 SS-4) TaxID=945553 RepID=A0A0D2P0A1_HYPSF|nr:hypothetical protein HYPSUDRAFT_214559 [Hypholoma sublateritium FD-334 SS-4]